MNEENLIKERQKKLTNFIKTKYSWITYVLLAGIIYLAVWIRTRNLSGLKDVTTGSWTLGPDLDPFLFLRWTQEIVSHGFLPAIDPLRYVPLAFNTKDELLLHVDLIAWFHHLATAIGLSSSVTYSAVIYPVFMFALAVIAFFLFVRKLFIDQLGPFYSNLVALISCFFLSTIPSLLPRTIAGIPEKEASSLVFFFAAFYLFLLAWKSNKYSHKVIFGSLAALSTAAMALVWGGYIFVILTISLSVFLAFFLNKIDNKQFVLYSIWVFITDLILILSTPRYSLGTIVNSTTTAIPLLVFLLLAVHKIIVNTQIKKYLESEKLSKVPKPVISFAISIILGAIFVSIIYGPSFIIDKIQDLAKPLIQPISDRLGVTVAENRQPFFNEWAGSFGPFIKSTPIFFWLFFVGSIYLYWKMLKPFGKKERLYLTAAYVFFLFAITFSRYSETSIFNGTNAASIGFYLLGVIALVGSFLYYYFINYKKGEVKMNDLEFSLILLFSLFFLCIISARGAVRLVMVLVVPVSIIVSYMLISGIKDTFKVKDETMRLFAIFAVIIVVVACLFSAYSFTLSSRDIAKGYVPSIYTQQWQKAMAWVRESTSQNAVFAHWWDYGYWVQTMGERATMLDGGNYYPYWDYLVGRYALTGSNERESLEVLYSHNVTHFLIDSTDIGKYTAFSSIGSDENYDRYSWLSTFLKDSKQTQETKNSTVYVYTGGTYLDGDITYMQNGTLTFLPAGSAGIGAIITEVDSSGNLIKQPEGVYVYQNKQYQLPLRYVYNNKLIDFGSGVDAGVFLYPRVVQSDNKISLEENGAAMYLSNKTVRSQLARLYLYGEKDQYFNLVHSEDDFLVDYLKKQNANIPSIIYDDIYANARGQAFAGPIKIWELSYPQDIQTNQAFIQTDYPEEISGRK